MQSEEVVQFEVKHRPVGKARPRFTMKGFAYTPKTTREFESAIRKEAKKAMAGRAPFGKDIEIQMTINFTFHVLKSWSKMKREHCLENHTARITKPDIDNLGKSVLDALNGIVYEDDANVSTITLSKHYGLEDNVSVSVEGRIPA